ncbi:MAG: heparinase II/III family protein [Planctomycetota bacterium]|nr:heparinase II/III family protein [Planctomycetota bacterium]
MQSPTHINEAEAIFQRFYDPHRCYIESWNFKAAPETGSRILQQFHATEIHWERGAGGLVAMLSKDMEVDASRHNRLIVCCTLPETTQLKITLTVDGAVQEVIHEKGTNTSEEWSNNFKGDVISHVEIELLDNGEGPANAQLFWLGLADSTRLKDMEERPNPWQGAWDDLMVPQNETVAMKPAIGLLFGEEDLERLRAKVQKSPYKELMDCMRNQASEFLEHEPWRGVGNYPNMRKPRCYRLRGNEHISLLAMRLGAFVGLIDRNEQLSRMAVDHALALAHCDKWQPEFMPSIAGSAWEQRAFHEYRYAHNLIFAWDWAGSFLTASGKQVLAQAVSIKALPWILQTLMRHPYVRGCNQGAYFSWGAIICELALSSIYPDGDELLDVAIQALDQTVNKYFQEDGGAFEGPGYVTSTAAHALAAYSLVSRHRSQSLEDLVPPNLKNVSQYIRTMLSTLPPYGSAIKVADGGHAGTIVYQDCLGLLASVSDDAAVGALLNGMALQGEHTDNAATPGAAFNIVFGPEELPEPSVQPPVFHVLEQTGMLCSCRPTPHGPVRLQLIGGPAKAGHAHDDRGSLVIEAFGEEIVYERGQMPYDDPRCTTIKFARYHNLLIPAGPDTSLPRQLNPCPDATIPMGTGDEQSLDCRIDVTAAWGGLVLRCVRRIVSKDPSAFVIEDELELPEARGVSFHLDSKFPWRKTDTGWVTQGERACLTVKPDWETSDERGVEDFIDGQKEPVFHLTLHAAPSLSHRLKTRLELMSNE